MSADGKTRWGPTAAAPAPGSLRCLNPPVLGRRLCTHAAGHTGDHSDGRTSWYRSDHGGGQGTMTAPPADTGAKATAEPPPANTGGSHDRDATKAPERGAGRNQAGVAAGGKLLGRAVGPQRAASEHARDAADERGASGPTDGRRSPVGPAPDSEVAAPALTSPPPPEPPLNAVLKLKLREADEKYDEADRESNFRQCHYYEGMAAGLQFALKANSGAAAAPAPTDEDCPMQTGRHRNMADKALGPVRRMRIGKNGGYPEIGTVEVMNAAKALASAYAEIDWLKGKLAAAAPAPKAPEPQPDDRCEHCGVGYYDCDRPQADTGAKATASINLPSPDNSLPVAKAAEDRLWDLHREVKELPFETARKVLVAAFKECDKKCTSHRLDLCEHRMMPRYVPVSRELRKMWNEDRPHFMGPDRAGSPHRYDGYSEGAECVYCCRPKNYVPRKRAARAEK